MGLSPHHIKPLSRTKNGRVENAVKTCKSLLTKARADKRDPLLALLEWRNTPTEGMNASPVQLLYGRRTRTRLPVAKQLLTPQVILMSPKRSRLGSRSRNTTMIVTHVNCQNCMMVMPLECDCHARRNGHWGASLDRKGPVRPVPTWLR